MRCSQRALLSRGLLFYARTRLFRPLPFPSSYVSPSPHPAAIAPAAPVTELGVVRRFLAFPVKAIIPISPEDLGGPSVTVDAEDFEVLAERAQVVLAQFDPIPSSVRWFDTHELMYCQQQHAPDTIKVIRKATEDERKRYRVVLWIQGDEIPECCGQPMFFVGQIDDDFICTERPEGAKLWWHDQASFYVFTCSQCLECKAVGQQM